MKDPLPESPFPAVHFSQQECLEFRTLALTLVDECLEEFEDHVVTNNRVVNKRKWREIKALENVTVYKRMTKEERNADRMATRKPTTSSVSSQRDSLSSSSSSAGTVYTATFDWQLPKIIGVGKIVGTLEDVMYGLLTPDKEAMRVNTAYINDEYIDSRVLCSMQCPTETKPFQFLGVKWAVRGQGNVVKARDVVFIEATGIKLRPNGERVGYWVQHSIDIPQYDELKVLGIVRSRQSWTTVFRETGSGSVELYTRMHLDPGGNITERLAVQSAANCILTIWKLPSCSHNKKLAWIMRDSSSKRNPGVVAKAKSERGKNCNLCSKSVSMFGTLTTCELCLHKICSRCLTMRQLSYIRATGQVFTVPTGFCKNCITRGAKTSAVDISILEYVPDAPEREPEIIETSEIFNTNSSRRRDSSRSVSKSVPASPNSFIATPLGGGVPMAKAASLPSAQVSDSLYDSGRGGAPVYYQQENHRESSRHAVPPPRGLALTEPMQPRVTQGHHYQQQPPPHVIPYAAHVPSQQQGDDHRRFLWEQMNQLRLQAEEAYWQTKRNGVAMHDN